MLCVAGVLGGVYMRPIETVKEERGEWLVCLNLWQPAAR
jgi:hypothetical protein